MNERSGNRFPLRFHLYGEDFLSFGLAVKAGFSCRIVSTCIARVTLHLVIS
jgi:hypothetical protein